jgi:hypothetical protein
MSLAPLPAGGRTVETSRLASVTLLVLALFAWGTPVSAQTDTPTPPPATATPTATCTPRNAPPPCSGAKKLTLAWFAKDPLTLRVAISATGCPAIPSCQLAVDGELVSVPPPSVEIRDSANQTFVKTITDPGFNTGGCPGGSDVYRGVSRLKLVFGVNGQTTIIGKVRVAQLQPLPPTFSPPITITVRDACGVLDTATVNTCYPRVSTTTASLKCF